MSGNAREDIITASTNTEVEQYISAVMAAAPNFRFEYTAGLSRVDRVNGIIYINSQNTGSALVGAATHELAHLGTYNQYVQEVKAAFDRSDFTGVVNAMVMNEARTTAGAISIANPNDFTSGYITIEQASQAMLVAAQIAGNMDSSAYSTALTNQIAGFINENSSVRAELESLASAWFAAQYPDTRSYPPVTPPSAADGAGGSSTYYGQYYVQQGGAVAAGGTLIGKHWFYSTPLDPMGASVDDAGGLDLGENQVSPLVAPTAAAVDRGAASLIVAMASFGVGSQCVCAMSNPLDRSQMCQLAVSLSSQ